MYAGVAQLVRASACHAEGRGFKSLHSRQFSFQYFFREVILGSFIVYLNCMLVIFLILMVKKIFIYPLLGTDNH